MKTDICTYLFVVVGSVSCSCSGFVQVSSECHMIMPWLCTHAHTHRYSVQLYAPADYSYLRPTVDSAGIAVPQLNPYMPVWVNGSLVWGNPDRGATTTLARSKQQCNGQVGLLPESGHHFPSTQKLSTCCLPASVPSQLLRCIARHM